MNFIDLITGNDIERNLNAIEDEIKELPLEYQGLYAQIEERLSLHMNFTGRNLVPILEGVKDFLIESHSEDLIVEEIINDLDQFVADLAVDEPSIDVRDKWRKQLNRNVAKYLGEE